MSKTGVYAILNKENGKMYIGSSINIPGRFIDHRKYLRKGNHGNKIFQNDWNIYGEHNFELIILEYVEKNLIEREQYWIEKNRGNLYNISQNATTLGVKHSEESNKKKGKNNPWLGRKHTKETRQKISKTLSNGMLKGENNPMFGKKHSNETKQKLRKLTLEQCIEIKKMLDNNVEWKKIMDDFKISKYVISQIKQGKHWSCKEMKNNG